MAAVHSPNNYFVYPAMGPRLERDVRYVNINRGGPSPRRRSIPQCQPRVDPAPEAWMANLAKHHIRWVPSAATPASTSRRAGVGGRQPARSSRSRFADNTNLIYEFLPGAGEAP